MSRGARATRPPKAMRTQRLAGPIIGGALALGVSAVIAVAVVEPLPAKPDRPERADLLAAQLVKERASHKRQVRTLRVENRKLRAALRSERKKPSYPRIALPPDYIKRCESGGNYRAVNPSSGAGGAWQFLPSTWRSVGGSGLPQHASPAEQDYRAGLLWDGGRGASHWVCHAG